MLSWYHKLVILIFLLPFSFLQLGSLNRTLQISSLDNVVNQLLARSQSLYNSLSKVQQPLRIFKTSATSRSLIIKTHEYMVIFCCLPCRMDMRTLHTSCWKPEDKCSNGKSIFESLHVHLFPFLQISIHSISTSHLLFFTHHVFHILHRCLPKCIPPKCTWKWSHSISIITSFPMKVDGKKIIYVRMLSRRPEKSVKFWTFTATSNLIWISPYWVCRIGGCDFK